MAAIPLPDNRRAYKASGQLRWHVWIPGFAIAIGLAGLMAFAFEHLSRAGWHYIFVTPLLMALPVAGWWCVVQYASRLRAPVLAAVCGFFLGLIVFLGHFHAGLIIDYGVKLALRVDLTAELLSDRMHRQKIQKGVAPNDPKPPGDVDILFNWFFLIAETIVCGVVVAAGATPAVRPFSERYQEALKKITFALQPCLKELTDAMREQSPDQFRLAVAYGMRPAEPRVKKKKSDPVPSATLSVFFLPAADGLPYRDDPPVESYVSVAEVNPDRGKPATIVHWELLPAELDIVEEMLIRPLVTGMPFVLPPAAEPEQPNQ